MLCPLAPARVASYPVPVRRLVVSLSLLSAPASRLVALRVARGRVGLVPRRTCSSNPSPCWAHKGEGPDHLAAIRAFQLRGQDLNLRPSGYEPDELPGCSTPRQRCGGLVPADLLTVKESFLPSEALRIRQRALPFKTQRSSIWLRSHFGTRPWSRPCAKVSAASKFQRFRTAAILASSA